ncbi:MAG: TM0106 family RecB-like putative nuclease [Propionibacteriaceae bacterium]|nr:TM0106 family RecB-like putative nuclease [Propionibacteriaceae bacterium]
MTVLLGAYAARSCPVKTHHAYDSTIERTSWEPDESLAELFEGGLEFETHILDTFAASLDGTLADLRPLREQSLAARTDACLQAMRTGVEVILGGWLPVDLAGQRTGSPDALVRGIDQIDGTPRYHPVEVKWHKIIERRGLKRSQSSTPPLAYTTLASPRPLPTLVVEGYGVRVASREPDLIQLAHYHRMLAAAGFATVDHAAAAIIGTDDVLRQAVLAWVDLAEPLVRTFSRSQPGGWRLRSLLERYDHEHAFRIDVAVAAQRRRAAGGGTGQADVDRPPLVRPIVTRECGRCQWWERCLPLLDPEDVSLRIDKGPLDVREIAALRRLGVGTLTELASADLDQLLVAYLPEVTHRSGAESRLKVACRRARMLLRGDPFERETSGRIEVPAAEVEIDFDIETSAQGRVYLWGFLLHESGGSPEARYVEFSRFAELDSSAELSLAREALTWLRGLVDSPRSIRVYHYSEYEVVAMRALAARVDDPLLSWAADYAETEFVDLLEIVKAHFFGASGLGLKVVATKAAGFAWRDDDPGGLNSQSWFTEAVHGENAELRAAARRRVLAYNEDDVIATSRVREWLRAC